jgi:hypothetical protein
LSTHFLLAPFLFVLFGFADGFKAHCTFRGGLGIVISVLIIRSLRFG